MSVIQVNRVGNIISGHVNGVPYSVNFSEGKYKVMLELQDKATKFKSIEELRYIVEQFKLLTLENYGDFVETRSPYIKVNKDTNKFHLQYNGVISSKQMPDKLAQRIITAVERTVDILPLVKFWIRFLHCPVYTDNKAKRLVDYISTDYVNTELVKELTQKSGLQEVVAVKMATTGQVAISQEGLLVGYKVSSEITSRFYDTKRLPDIGVPREVVDPTTGLILYDTNKYDEDRIFEPTCQHQNGDAFYCGNYLGHIIRVGKIHYLPRWDQVDCDDSTTSRPGLHCGGLNYIRGYQNSGTVTHNIFVDPSHIGAIAGIHDHSDGALRVKQYFVYSAFSGVNKNLYYSSNYGALTDLERSVKRAVNREFD